MRGRVVGCVLLERTQWGSTGGAGGDTAQIPVDPGNVLIHRLNTAEYNNTVDVLGTAQQPGTALWAEE